MLPVPLADVLRTIAQAGNNFGQLVQWRQISGDPVALVHLLHGVDDDVHLQLEAIELREGEIYVAGRTLSPSAAELARRERPIHSDSDTVDESASETSADEQPDADSQDAEGSNASSAPDDERAVDETTTDNSAVTAQRVNPLRSNGQAGKAVKKNSQR